MTTSVVSLLLCISVLPWATKEDDLPWALKNVYSKNEYYLYEAVSIIVAHEKQPVEKLLKALPQCPVHLQPLIIQGFAQLGPRAKPAIDALHKLLSAKDRDVRSSAILALGRIDSERFTPEFVALYDRETDEDVKSSLLTVISITSPEIKRILAKALNRKPPSMEAVELAKKLGPEAKESLPRIMEIARSKANYHGVRKEAIAAIGTIDPHSDAAIETLEKLAGLEDSNVQSAALEALALSQHPRAVEIIKRHLADEFPNIRGTAALSLGARKEQSAVTELLRMLKEDELEVQIDVIWALWQMEGNANETAARYSEVLRIALQQNSKNDINEWELMGAVQLTGKLGPMAGTSVPHLRVLLGNRSHWVRRETIESLQAIGEPAFPAIPNLRYVARHDSNPEVREAAKACVKALEQQQTALESAK